MVARLKLHLRCVVGILTVLPQLCADLHGFLNVSTASEDGVKVRGVDFVFEFGVKEVGGVSCRSP